MQCLLAIRYLCRTMEPPVVIFQAEMHIAYISRFSVYLSCQTVPGYFYAMIIKPPVVMNTAMKPLLQSSVRTISMCVKASPQRSLRSEERRVGKSVENGVCGISGRKQENDTETT